MQVRSTYRFARISAFKAREVTREIQGLPASDALNLLRFVPKKAAGLVREAVVGEGPTAKRFQPKARGSAGPIRKRTSHIRIILTDEIEIKRREKRDRRKSKKASSSKPAARKSTRKQTKEAPAAQPKAAPESKE
jgi:large subunit ribosomal protein L22